MRTSATINISVENVKSEDFDKLLWKGQALMNDVKTAFGDSVSFRFNVSDYPDRTSNGLMDLDDE